MDIFPESPVPVYPAVITPVWKTLISDYEEGGEQRRSKWMFAKYDVTQQYKNINLTEARILWDFYMAQKGAYKTFYFFDFYALNHNEMYVGTGDGSISTFDIPGKSTSSRKLYVNGTETTTGFSYLAGGGDGNADRVQFTTAPASGQIITIDFTGCLRIKCRFEQDKLDRENFIINLFRYGIKLKGV